MPESRDRIARTENIAAIFTRQRQAVRQIGILVDADLIDTSRTAPRTVVRPLGISTGGGRGRFGTPRTGYGRGRIFYGSAIAVGRENSPAHRTVRHVQDSVLPSWYPRTPLRDITDVVRAIERRRARLREVEDQDTGSPSFQQDQTPIDPTLNITNAPLEHHFPMMTPKPAVPLKKSYSTLSGKLPKILLEISHNNAESDYLTPQKKLLNSIDTVEKVVMEELNIQKRTPTAKRAERERRVRTLMSMR